MSALRIAQINYPIRTGAFGYCFLVIGILLLERQAGATAWWLLVAQFLVYPQLVYLIASRARHSSQVERAALLADAALLGAWSAGLGFPIWVTYGLFCSTALNNAVYRGWKGALASMAFFGLGAFALLQTMGHVPQAPTSDVVTALCLFGSALYTIAVGLVLHWQIRALEAARTELRASEERYRLIAENAGDLIGMVDREGRWIYTSPSYGRLLPQDNVQVGADALGRVIEEDRLRVREAIQRVIHGGETCSLRMRISDAGGGVRRLDSMLHAARGADGQIKGVVIVSRDVTEAHAREQQLEVAAHAFEHMAEAIMITSADGRILTVNRAFTEITGYAAADVIGQPEANFRSAMQPGEFYDQLYTEVIRTGRWSGVTWARRADGTLYREWRSVSAVRDADGGISHFIALFHDLGGARPGALYGAARTGS
ncbi:MAG: PAS domain S-box protein [Burkholderiales bacterium]|nr:PAS domain S-box protein [Burkholderiales bacterium]